MYETSIADLHQSVLTRVTARRCWVLVEDSLENIVEALQAIYLYAAELSLLFHLPHKPTFLIQNLLTEVDNKMFEA